MRRVIAALWGSDSAGWTGRSVTLYCDKTVQFGGQTVGGIRISHMSHIDGVQKASIIPTRGKSALWTVQPLADAHAVPTEADVQASTDTETLRSWWQHAHLQSAIKARVDELKAEQDAGADPVEPDLFERGE
jgi:hypothetical protein